MTSQTELSTLKFYFFLIHRVTRCEKNFNIVLELVTRDLYKNKISELLTRKNKSIKISELLQ